MSDGLGDESNERRGFLKRVACCFRRSAFRRGTRKRRWGRVPDRGAARAAAEAAAQVNAVVGYNSLSPDEAAFVETLVNIMCPADEYTPNGVDCGLANLH